MVDVFTVGNVLIISILDLKNASEHHYRIVKHAIVFLMVPLKSPQLRDTKNYSLTNELLFLKDEP